MSSIIRATTTSGLQVAPDNSGSLQLQTNGTTAAVTIDTSQNVGIGTTSPAAKFQVNGAIRTTFSGDTNYYGTFNNATGAVQVYANGDSAPLLFGTTSVGGSTATERMRIDSSGNLNIGLTSTPSGWGPLIRASIKQSSSSGVAGFVSFSSSNENAIYVGYDSAYSLGKIGVSYATTGSFTPLVFETSTTERMRIDTSGNVNIGQSSAFASSIRTTIKAADTSSQSLALVSAVTSGTGTLQYLVDGSNDVCGYIGINATANTTSYNTSSDYRLKENIIPMTGALDKVSQLKPVLWNWKHAPEVIGQGFIAHELAEVIPDAVSGEKDAVDAEGKPVYQGVDTSFLVATLTAAIQEQQTIINDLKARIETLEAK